MHLQRATAPAELRAQLDRVADPGGENIIQHARLDEDIGALVHVLRVQVEALLAQFREQVQLVQLLVTEGRAGLAAEAVVADLRQPLAGGADRLVQRLLDEN